MPKSLRRLVFYSEGKNYWAHLSGIVHTLLEQSDLPVCYITSGKDDPGLFLKHKNFYSFKTDEGWVRNWLFENIETRLMVMTMPDLHVYQVKKSRYPVHYMYAPHSAVSLHMVYRPGAFDHYDSIFCVGPHHMPEMRAIEKQRGLKSKHLIEGGYSRLDSLIRDAEKQKTLKNPGSPIHVLIAPSWGKSSIIESVGMDLVECLLKQGFQVTLRPHPQTLKFHKNLVDDIRRRFEENNLLSIETDVAGKDSLYHSDIMISDWSGAALDYAFSLGKPVLFVDVPRKINNPDYIDIGIIPFEEEIRDKIGAVIAPTKIAEAPKIIENLLSSRMPGMPDREPAVKYFYNIGNSDKIALDEILKILKEENHD